VKYVLERELDIAILEAQIDADELYDLFMVEFLGSRTQQGKSSPKPYTGMSRTSAPPPQEQMQDGSQNIY